MIYSPPVCTVSTTFYRETGASASGLKLSECARRFGYYCASNRYPLLSRLLVSRHGKAVRVVVVDRIGHGSECDLCPAAFARLAPLSAGRIEAQVRVLSRPKKAHKKHGRGRR